jgi:hypothetical protein
MSRPKPVLDASLLADVWHGRAVSMPAGVVRALADWTWRLHLQPTDAGWWIWGFTPP